MEVIGLILPTPYFSNFGKPCPTAVHCASNSWPLVRGHILILFHLRRDQRLTTTKPYLFTIGQMFNPNSMNNLQLREFVLSLSNYASLNSWPRNRGHQTRAERQRITWIRSKKMKWCKWLPCAILSNLHWQAVAIFPRMMPLSYNCLNWSKHSAASSFSG